MDRVLIIGCPGSGKTTFARQLAKKKQLPLVHLDKLYWCGQWEHLSREEFDKLLEKELANPQWIMDGNFNRTIPHRLTYCDTVFFFDLPTITCLWGITKRVLTNYGKAREDMGGHCVERFDTQKRALYKAVFTFRRDHRKNYYQLLNGAKDKQIIIFKSRRQGTKYLKNIKAGESPASV